MIIVDLLIICIMVGLAVYSIENRRMNVENEEQINRLNKIVTDIEKDIDTEIKDIKRIYVVQAVKLRNLEEKDTLLAQQK
jgi:H2-forming N5,N10-methylenetetrahydromethanopterin dehydrogenase-like enzyme